MQMLYLLLVLAITTVYSEFKLDGKSPLCWHEGNGIACPEELAFDMSEAKTVVNANAGMDIVFAALLPPSYVLYINGERELTRRWIVDGYSTYRGHLRVCALNVVCSPYTEDDDLVTKTNFEKQVFRSNSVAPYEQKLVFPSAGEYQVVASMRLAGRYSGSLNKQITYEFDIAIGLYVIATENGELPAGVTYPANPVGPVDESQTSIDTTTPDQRDPALPIDSQKREIDHKADSSDDASGSSMLWVIILIGILILLLFTVYLVFRYKSEKAQQSNTHYTSPVVPAAQEPVV